MNPSLLAQFQKTKPGDVGIFGDPIAHSLSPVMQNAAFKTWTGAFRDNDKPTPVYHRFHVHSGELGEAIECLSKFQLMGVNITVPHKEAVIPWLTKVDSFAKKVGAVNTVVLSNHELKGFNTDADGFRRSLERDQHLELNDMKALILGAGGTGRVVVQSLLTAGAQHIFVWNRSEQRARELLSSVGELIDRITVVTPATDVRSLLSSVQLIVNTTSVGLAEGDGLPWPSLAFRSGHVAFDVVYHRDTEFLKQARAAGATAVNGMGMLLYQGAKAFELWTRAPAPVDMMRAALLQHLKQG